MAQLRPAFITWILAAWLGLSAPANAQAPASPDGTRPREAPITVTVVPFASADVGQDAWLGKAIADLLSRKLAEAPSYAVLNRDMLQTFLDEMELQASGFFTQEEAGRLGRIAKVEQVVYGNFRRHNDSLAINLLLVDLATQQGIKTAQASGSLEAMHELVAGLALQVLSLEGVTPSPDLDAKIRFAPTTSLPAIEHFYTAFDHLDQGRHEEAFGAFYAATQRDPDFREAELWMGRTLESSGFDDLAVLAYDKLAKRPGRHVEILDARFLKARLLEDTNHEATVATYRQLADLRPETPHTLEEAFRLGALLEQDGDVAGAYEYLLLIDHFRALVEEKTGATQRSSVAAGTLATLLNEVWVYFQSDAAARSRQSSLPYYITESGLRRSRFFDWPHALGLYREAILKLALLLPALPKDQDASRLLPRGVLLVDPADPTIVERNHAIRPSLFHEETVGPSWREKFFAIALPPGYVATGVEMEVAGRVRKRSPSISYSMRLLPFPWPANYHNAWLGTIYGQTAEFTRLRKSVDFHGQTRTALALQFTESSSEIREWRLKVKLRPGAEPAPSVPTPPVDFEGFQEGQMVSRMAGTTGPVEGPALPLFKYLRLSRSCLALANSYGRGLDLIFVRGELGGNPTDLWGSHSADGTSWTSPQRLPTNSASEDFAPRLLRSERGDLRLFWLSDRRGAGWEMWTSLKPGPDAPWQAPSRIRLDGTDGERTAPRQDGPRGLIHYAVAQDRSGRWLVGSVEAGQSRILLTVSEDGTTWEPVGELSAPATIGALVLTQDTSGRYLLGGTTSDHRIRLWRSNDFRQWQGLRLRGDRHFTSSYGPASGYPSQLFAEPGGQLLLVVSDFKFGLRYARFNPESGTVSLDLIKDAGLEAYAIAALQDGSYLIALEKPDGIDLLRYRRFQSPHNGDNPPDRPIYAEVEVDRAGNRWHRTFARSRYIAPDVTAIAGEADGRVWWGIESGVMSVKDGDFFFQDASMGFFTHNIAKIRPCGNMVYFAALHDDQDRLAMARVSQSAGGGATRRTHYAVEVISLPDTRGAVTALFCDAGPDTGTPTLLVGTADGDLLSVNHHEVLWQRKLAEGTAVTAITTAATDALLYAATSAGDLYQLKDGTVLPVAQPGEVAPISALTVDRSGRLWIARAGKGLYRRDASVWTRVAADTFPYRSVAALQADPRRGVWVLPGSDVTSVGLAHVTDEGFQLFNPPGRRLAQPIDMDVVDDGHVWIGTALNGFYRLERAQP